MIIKSEKMLCGGKEIQKGVSQKGNDYENKVVYFYDNDGLLIRMSFNNDKVYNKALENKQYILKFYLATNGRIELNDIDEVK